MNRNRPVQYATGEYFEEESPSSVDPYLVAAQRARLPRGMREVGISNAGRLEGVKGTFRLYFEVNATLLGNLLESHPDTWLDEYLLFGRMRAAGVVKTITEYKQIFPNGQVEEPTGEFDDVDRGDELIEEIMRPLCQVGE